LGRKKVMRLTSGVGLLASERGEETRALRCWALARRKSWAYDALAQAGKEEVGSRESRAGWLLWARIGERESFLLLFSIISKIILNHFQKHFETF